jgi:hypothetical protein
MHKRIELPEYTVISHDGNAETRDITTFGSEEALVGALKGDGFRFCHIEAIFYKGTDVTQEYEEYIN